MYVLPVRRRLVKHINYRPTMSRGAEICHALVQIITNVIYIYIFPTPVTRRYRRHKVVTGVGNTM